MKFFIFLVMASTLVSCAGLKLSPEAEKVKVIKLNAPSKQQLENEEKKLLSANCKFIDEFGQGPMSVGDDEILLIHIKNKVADRKGNTVIAIFDFLPNGLTTLNKAYSCQ